MKKLFLTLLLLTTLKAFSQVSHYSTPLKSNDYVQPVDLNLLERVQTQKQNNYLRNESVLREQLKTISKLLNYVKGNNRNTLTKEYNEAIRFFNNYDLGDYNVVRVIKQKLDYIETWIDLLYQYPNTIVPSNN